MSLSALLVGCSNEVVVFGSGGAGAEAGSGGIGGMTGSGGGGMSGSGGGGDPSVCNNGVLEAGEECDGMDLGGASCTSLGFEAGTLTCAVDCSFGVYNCYTCGDGIISGPEQCDGMDLDGATCIDQGYDGGTLACLPGSCSYDESGCFIGMENCSNGIDDDGDGLTDCDDPICQGTVECSPVEAITGCDPSLCTFAMGAGPNGGDLCTCTIEGARHPVSDDLMGGLCPLFNNGNELTITFNTAGYNAFSVSTCESNPGDSSLAAFDGDPAGMAMMLGCDGDASGEMSFCSELIDSNDSGPPTVQAMPASGQLWIQVDEFSAGNYWNQMEPRVIQIELLGQVSSEAGLCSDGVDNDNDMATDCADSDCAGDPSCLPAVESINGCDPSYCTLTMGAGPNGGDLCSCTLPAGSHPQMDDYQIMPGCAFFGGGLDLTLTFSAVGYSSYSVNTCAFAGDSSVQVLDNDPMMGGMQIACSGDAMGQPMFCAEVGDSGSNGPPVPSPVPASNMLFINIEEFNSGAYWNNSTTRQIDIELIP